MRLKAKNKTIKSSHSPIFRKLLKDLKDTMYKTDLVGIAAPQIAENYQIFVTHPRNTKFRKLPKTDIFRVFVNPRITFYSKQENLIYEGCGSVVNGELFGPVTRSKEVIIEAYDERGQKFSLRSDGILARIIQHEFDHLRGTEFIQKIDDYSKVMNSEHYQKQIRNSPKQLKASKITKIEYKKL